MDLIIPGLIGVGAAAVLSPFIFRVASQIAQRDRADQGDVVTVGFLEEAFEAFIRPFILPTILVAAAVAITAAAVAIIVLKVI